ncbi:YesK-like protein [Halobacillus dabanensis]|uniref:YesK-like protein n=1 Tax=Halobacillus dabanensis TaxID=240302 RepID=A0A1I4AYE0_HALDA|nr:YesK family protein [Halobacillus dabanensis]SFK61525.1 YesK-like protein [Halobacillus dabanensis]
MLQGPFLVTIVPGVIVLLITWWLRKKDLPIFVRNVPGILTLLVAITLFYIGFARIRGFEGGAYGILAFFLLLVSIVSFVIVNPQKHK